MLSLACVRVIICIIGRFVWRAIAEQVWNYFAAIPTIQPQLESIDPYLIRG